VARPNLRKGPPPTGEFVSGLEKRIHIPQVDYSMIQSHNGGDVPDAGYAAQRFLRLLLRRY
jgi:hypothetical protein